jgi:Protein of unknown function (DUF2867)
MRLPNSDHESRPWRIVEITPDFRLEDVWALPAQGGAEDFEALLEVMASLDPAHGESAATRVLFSIRYRVGGWFGWDEAARELAIPGNAETTLSARFPVDLRNTATDLDRSSISTSSRLPGADAADRTSLERQTRTADRVITSPRSRRNHRSAHMPLNVAEPAAELDERPRRIFTILSHPPVQECTRPLSNSPRALGAWGSTTARPSLSWGWVLGTGSRFLRET